MKYKDKEELNYIITNTIKENKCNIKKDKEVEQKSITEKPELKTKLDMAYTLIFTNREKPASFHIKNLE